MKSKRRIVILIISLLMFLLCYPVYALDNPDQTIDKQNEELLKKFDPGKANTGNNFDSVMKNYNDNTCKEIGNFNKDSIVFNLNKNLFQLSLNARKYSIPIFMVVLVINIILVSTIGSQNIGKRKSAIIKSFGFTIIFMLFLNLPILLIYFQYVPLKSITPLVVMKNLFKIVEFFNKNAPIILIILVLFGIVNKAISKNNVSKRIHGTYLIKAGIFSFIALKLLPILINFIM